MSQWTRDTPSLGDHGQVTSASAVLDDISRTLTDLKTMVSTQNGRISDSTWQGLSGQAFRDRGITIAAELGTFTQWMADTASALSVYAGKLSTLETSERLIRPQLTTARSAAQRATNKLAFATDPDERRTLTATLDREEAKVRACQSAWDDLVAERESMDTILRQQLSTAPAVSFTQIGQVMIRAGHQPNQPLTAENIVDALTALSEDVLDGDHDPATLAALAELLRYTCIDPGLADEYMQELGGTNLANLLVQLDVLAAGDPSLSRTIADVQSRLRQSLAIGSVSWEPEVCDSFNEALMDATNGALVVAYLYGDTDVPIAAKMAISMAGLIQKWEKRNGQLFTMLDSVGPNGVASSLMASTLDLRPNEHGMVIIDPADSVLRQIALHPTAALDWLDASDHLDYWYGTRDWSTTGGYDAPAAVWAAVQTVPGALIGPDMDPALVNKLARVSTDILNYWHPDVLTEENFDGDGKQYLALVIAAQLPIWVETTIAADYDILESAETRNLPVDWLGSTGDVALCSRDALAALLRIVASDPIASGVVLERARSLSVEIVSSVPANADMDSYKVALGKAGGLLGLLDGADLGNQLSAHAASDLRTSLVINTVSMGTAGVADKAVGPLAGALLSQGATDLTASVLANSYNQRQDEFWSGGSPDDQRRREEANDVLKSLATNYIPPVTVENSLEDIDDVAAEGISNYSSTKTWVANVR